MTVLAGRALLAGSAVALARCSGAPAVNVAGSYFPAWMLCAILGLAGAVAVRQVVLVLGLEQALVLPLVTHALVAAALTLGVWLFWFGH